MLERDEYPKAGDWIDKFGSFIHVLYFLTQEDIQGQHSTWYPVCFTRYDLCQQTVEHVSSLQVDTPQCLKQVLNIGKWKSLMRYTLL